jgi:hypothetical protein
MMAAGMQSAEPPRVIDKGDQSNVDAARQVMVRDAAAWSALWKQHSPDRPPPAIDFRRDMVAAVFLGSRPSAGFAVEIVGTKDDAGTLVVQYREGRPARGMLTAQVLTFPYAIAALPRRDGNVRFERVN